MLGFGLSIEPQLWTLLFVMVRIGAAFIAAPVFGAVSVPVTVRVTLSGAIAVLVINVQHIQPPAQVFSLMTFLAVGTEALTGLALGFVIQIAFAAPLVAGELIGNAMGLGFAAAIDPQNGHSSTALSQFLMTLMTLLFLSLNGHLILTDIIVKSYEAMPPGKSWLAVERLRDIVFFGGYALLAGFLLALPVGFLLLCLNLVVGMLSRSAPALNLFAVGLPMSLAVGVVALAIAFPAMGDYMVVIVGDGLSATQRLVFG